MSNRTLVRNGADPQQVKRAARIEQRRAERLDAALRASLAVPAVRLVFAELLARAGLYGTVYDPSGSAMYFKEGRRNFGLQIQALLLAADEPLADLMERERRARQRADDREVDAGYPPPTAAEEQTTDD